VADMDADGNGTIEQDEFLKVRVLGYNSHLA
jgi:hypothetical protein